VLPYLLDECVHGGLVEALLEHEPRLDVVRVQDVGLGSADDRLILARAAAERRIVVTNDRSTLIGFAYDRVRAGQAMPGVVVLNQNMSLGDTVEQLLLIAICSTAEEREGTVNYLPLRA
jgi:predicted nuclease of predicted toxin-antitoxin system